MATPHQGYPQYGQPGYDPQQQEQYDANQHDVSEDISQGPAPAPSAGGRKKRHYAGQAYEFGAGGNAALGGQQQGGGQYPIPPAQGYAGYGQQPQHAPQQAGYPGPQYGSGPVSPVGAGGPGYGQQPQAMGGYQAPEPGYPAQGVPPSQPGMGGITQGMGAMTMGHQTQNQHPQMQGRLPMNQLYPTDILNAPLNVSELDLPPPPIILPPNVSMFCPGTRLKLTEVVERHALARSELPAQIRPINA